MRARGFLLGGTAGRTPLNGEGLQHQDGHSHLAAAATPNINAYDLAYAHEIAIVIHRGMKEMCQDDKDVIYYLTLENENYAHPPAPEGVADDSAIEDYGTETDADGVGVSLTWADGTMNVEGMRVLGNGTVN